MVGKQRRMVRFVGIMDHMKWNLDDVLKMKDFDKLFIEVEKDFEEAIKKLPAPKPVKSAKKKK